MLPFVYSTLVLGTFPCHTLFLFLFCNKILLDSCFACAMFLFLFFLFHDLDLELSLALFSFWLRNLIILVVFVLVTYNWQQLQQA